MEIPEELKKLYKHWQFHTIVNDGACVSMDGAVLNDVVEFLKERMLIWNKRQKGEKYPWTGDCVLKNYRFCNIYRELDKQTIFFHTYLKQYEHNFDFWLLNMVFCRFIAKIDTIQQIGLLSFDYEENKKVFQKLKTLSSGKFGVPYVFPISTIMKSKYPTREEFFCFYLPIIIPEIAKIIKTFKKESVREALKRILPSFGYNLKFHWTEFLIDIAYQYPEYIDLFKEFPIGPGSESTMKLLNKNEAPEIVCLSLVGKRIKDFSYLTFNGKDVNLSAENWEGIGCEFRKYSNLKKGEGRRRKYAWK